MIFYSLERSRLVKRSRCDASLLPGEIPLVDAPAFAGETIAAGLEKGKPAPYQVRASGIALTKRLTAINDMTTSVRRSNARLLT
jgi:hypothetical protein